MSKKLIGSVLSLVVMCCLLALSGCLSSPQVTDPVPSSAVSFFNASPNGPDLDAFVDGTKLNATAFTYKYYSGFVSVTPGKRSVRFNSFGAGDVQIDTTFTFEVSKAYSIFVINKSTSPAVKTIKAMITDDSGTTIGNASNGLVRFAHLSPDTGPVNVSIKNSAGVARALGSGTTYGKVTTFQEFDPATYTVEIRRPSDDSVLLTFSIPIGQGVFQSILLVGYTSPPNGNTNTLTYKIVN